MLKVGLILYSVRQAMARDALGTVEAVGKLGYKNIEVCNHNAMQDSGIGFGVPAAELKGIFDKFGSNVVSAHLFPFERANLPEVIAYNRILGNKNIVIPMGFFTTYDALMRYCEFLNRTGKILSEEGMNLLYHNHEIEYRTFNGKTIMDYLVENTDPQYLSLELDSYWTMRAGYDPVKMIQYFGKRIKLLHQKDFPYDAAVPINALGFGSRELQPGESIGLDGESAYAKQAAQNQGVVIREETQVEALTRKSAFTEIGTGIMPIQKIINAANEYTDASYIILEQDATRLDSELESIRVSMDAFQKFKGICWEK